MPGTAVQDDDEASARLQTVNEAFEDAAPLRDVLLAVCREFGLAHAARCLKFSAQPVRPPRDAVMAEATGSAGAEGAAADDDDGDEEAAESEEEEEEEESDGDDEDDGLWSAAERDDKDMMVSPCSSPPHATSTACVHSSSLTDDQYRK